MKFISALCLVCLMFIQITLMAGPVQADEFDEVSKQLEETKKALESLQNANTNNKATLKEINEKINAITTQVQQLEILIEKKEREVKQGNEALKKQKRLLDSRIKEYYMNLKKTETGVIELITASDVSRVLNNFVYQQRGLEVDNNNLVGTIQFILGLENKQKTLVYEKGKLVPIEVELKKQSDFLLTEVSKADKTEGELKSKIADLSAKQQSILNARSGSSITSVGSVPTSGDQAATIAYKSQAPSGSFAVFSFGAYTHRRGMSQYGAKARAESGQSFSDILKAYYPDANLESKGDLPGDITVDGQGSMSFEDRYLLGIAEMPSDWSGEALKAQAVAARTYAYRRVKNGGSICTTEACQVFLPSKADNPPDAWKQAVQATKGQVLLAGGEPRSTEYSATSGGWNSPGGWDTTDGSNSGDWTSRAYESKANSPWFYRSWYRQGYRDDANSCGREHPWLSQAEMADIIHAWWLLRKESNGADTGRIIPTTINTCAVGGASGNPYSLSELKDLAGKSGKGITSISNVNVSNDGSGNTTNVHFDTNIGGIDIPGSEFKEVFNIRAPGYISIPQFGFSFFNIEKT